MEDAPANAPAEAPQAPESETTPTPTNAPEPAQAPDMHGFTSEQLADIDKFFKANGGFESIKSKISNPQRPAEAPQSPSEPQNDNQPTSHTTPPAEPQYKAPEGSITAQEFLAQQYFKTLAGEEKYAAISKEIAGGDVLKEMAAFNIQPLNQDGSINDVMVRRFLDLKAQTVPAKPTETQPNDSAAPTVTYTEVGEGGITNLDQAYKIIMEPNNPAAAKAEEYIKNHFSPNSAKKQ